ncbi:MAG: ABC transporter ATP-binding protein [Desulfuromonas sp.]|nr:MAG: ABC transporter ATP-binding protein [Desulfuromonas sp.]
MTTSAIRIENLGKLYRGKKRQLVHALTDLNLQVGQGEVFGFLGPNGAGKSTTIKLLLGLIQPTSGGAFLFNQPVSDASSRLRVGYLPENPAFYDFLSAREYLYFVAGSFGMKKEHIKEQSDRVLELLQLTDAANRPVSTYSKGMVQRLGLAQTLVHDPDLYIFDEPMSGLDPMGRALVKKIIRDLKGQGKTVFFSSHITADVESVCDRIGIIVKGELRSEESVGTLLHESIQGYSVWVRGPIEVDGYQGQLVADDVSAFRVPKEQLDLFIAAIVARQDCSIQLVEPERKDLEAFFLDVVARN